MAKKRKWDQVERRVLIEHFGRWLWVMRFMPWHAAHWLGGIVLPPHERHWLRTYFGGYKENNILASRGTSKSFTHASLAAPLDIALHKDRSVLLVSASGFRGGKLLMEDAKALIQGELRSQRLPGPFLAKSARNPKVIRQEPDRWILEWSTHSKYTTIPTHNEDTIRGVRARRVIVDERNTFSGEVVQKVIRPTMNVQGDFLKIASSEDANAIFQVSTIDYTFRDWYKEIANSRSLAKREYASMKALVGQDWGTYNNLMNENDGELREASSSLTRFDYTDLIIETEIDARDGKRYQIEYPLPPGLEPDDIRKWDERDRCHFWYTYPVDKKGLEEPWRNNTMDEELWRAEQRNVFITASGNVYPDELVRSASELPIYEAGEIPNYDLNVSEEEREHLDQFEFFPPVMDKCGDPCVLGMDYARERDDSAFIVIRLGPMATGKFDPFGKTLDEHGRPCYGETTWSSVIWAESWGKMTHYQAAEKIRELRARYNIINTSHLPEGYGGIGMDGRGGGLGVRDELSKPSAPVMANGLSDPMWQEPDKIYDPQDDSYMHYAAFEDPVKYWSGLRLLTPSNAENWEWTRYTKAAMENKSLYIGRYQDPSTWSTEKGLVNSRGGASKGDKEFLIWLAGYTGVLKLKNQLVRLQIEYTPTGNIRVMMPGTKGTEDGKKDLYSAFIYAWQVARMHLVNATKRDVPAPMVQPVMLKLGSDNTSNSIHRIGWGFQRGRNVF
jgi:hypothetical protein